MDKDLDIQKISSDVVEKITKKEKKQSTFSKIKSELSSENIAKCKENSTIINNRQCVMSLVSDLEFCKECIIIGFDPHHSYTCVKEANVKNFGTHRSRADWGKTSRMKNVDIIEKDFLLYDPSLITEKVQMVVYDYHVNNRYLYNSIKRLIPLLDDECVLIFDNHDRMTTLNGYIQGMRLLKDVYKTVKPLEVNSRSGLGVIYIKK
jgi:hypothetical protein